MNPLEPVRFPPQGAAIRTQCKIYLIRGKATHTYYL